MRTVRGTTYKLVAFGAILVAVGVQGAAAGAAPCWHPPVAGTVTDPYREPECRWCPGNRGLEYETEPGAPVRAVAAGVVTFAQSVAGRRYVVVAHPGGWRTTYGDLASIGVGRGDRVVARSIVGTAGATVHFGLRDRDGYRDPAPFIGKLTYRTRLVPVDGSPGGPPGRARITCSSRW